MSERDPDYDEGPVGFEETPAPVSASRHVSSGNIGVVAEEAPKAPKAPKSPKSPKPLSMKVGLSVLALTGIVGLGFLGVGVASSLQADDSKATNDKGSMSDGSKAGIEPGSIGDPADLGLVINDELPAGYSAEYCDGLLDLTEGAVAWMDESAANESGLMSSIPEAYLQAHSVLAGTNGPNSEVYAASLAELKKIDGEVDIETLNMAEIEGVSAAIEADTKACFVGFGSNNDLAKK